MKREVVVQSVALSEEGIEIQWMVLPDDVRSQGHLVSSRQTAISYVTSAGLGELAVDLRTAVDSLGRRLLEALETPDLLPVYEEPKVEPLGYTRIAVDDEDEDVGMGEGR